MKCVDIQKYALNIYRENMLIISSVLMPAISTVISWSDGEREDEKRKGEESVGRERRKENICPLVSICKLFK